MLIARIREEDCIGCAKCLPACPVDAILGAPKFLHTVITEACIGCKLCIAPCPVDCIEMLEDEKIDSPEQKLERAKKAKERFLARKKRLMITAKPQLMSLNDPTLKSKIRTEINEALERVKQKKSLFISGNTHD